MADKQVIIEFKIEGSEALNMTVALTDKLNALKQQKKELEKQLKEDSGNTALKEQLATVNAQIGSTATSLRGYQKELTNMAKINDQETNSLKQQQAQLAVLTSQWDRLSEAERNGAKGQDLINKIQATNANVSKLEESTGRFQRNVGNYKSALDGAGAALQGIGVSAGGAIGAIKGLGAAFKALIANPFGAAIAAIVAALMQLVKAIKNNDDAGTAFNELLATLRPILDVIKSLFEKLAVVLAGVFRKIADFNQKLLSHFPTLDAWAKKNREIVKSQDELEEQERRTSAAVAKLEAEAARAMEIATDAEEGTLSQRKKALNDWWEKQKQIYEANMKLEESRFKILVMNTAKEHGIIQRSGETWEEYTDRIAEYYDLFSDAEKKTITASYNAMEALQTGLVESERTYNKTKKRINNEARQAEEQRKKDEEDLNNALLTINEQTHQKLINDTNKYYDELVTKAHGNKRKIEEIERLRAVAIARIYSKEVEKGVKEYTDKLAQSLTNAKQRMETFTKQIDIWDEVAKLAESNEQQQMMNEAKTNAERLALATKFAKERMNIAQMMYDSMQKMDGETEAEFELRKQQQLAWLIKYKEEYENTVNEIEKNNTELFNQQLSMVGAFTDATTQMADAIIDALGKSASDEEKYQKWKLIMSIIEAQIQGALAIMSAIAVATPGDPYSVAARIASAASAAGAATIASVAQLTALKGGIPSAPKFAQGGYVSGKGTATSDDIMAWLSNGESVMTARTTKMFAPMLSAMNVAGGGAPITQAAQNNVMRNMWEEAFKDMPNPVVSVKEITNVNNRLQVKESISKAQ